MIGLHDDDYLPDEVLQDVDMQEELVSDDDLTELDFEDPLVTRQGVDQLLGDAETADDLFSIA